MKKLKKHFKGFTLVELIIVITILAILATIAFVSFKGYTLNARDGNRLATLNNIEKGLSLFQIKTGNYPDPDEKINIEASGTIISYQGIVGDNVSRNINMSKTPTDPLDNIKYVYSTNANKNKYQLLSYMEGTDYLSLVTQTYAEDLSTRNPYTIGNNIGIILNTDKSIITQTVDIVSSTGTYTMHFSNKDKISGTGNILKAGIAGGGLLGYWDFNSYSGTNFYDLSSNKLIGVSSGGVNIISSGRISGDNVLYFNSGSFEVNKILGLGESEGSPHSVSMWINIDNIPVCTNLSCRNWLMLLGKLGEGAHAWLFGGRDGPFQFGIVNGVFANNLTIEKNRWYHVVITYDGGKLNSYVNGYKNGQIVSNYATKTKNFNIKDAKLILGQKQIPNEQNYGGYIDEVRIYNRALSDKEIRDLYNATK